MYCIIVYDIEQKRVNKICKFLRRYLFWTQNSVFEGEIRESTLVEIECGLNKILDKDKDSIIVFIFERPKWIKRYVIGKEKGSTSRFI